MGGYVESFRRRLQATYRVSSYDFRISGVFVRKELFRMFPVFLVREWPGKSGEPKGIKQFRKKVEFF